MGNPEVIKTEVESVTVFNKSALIKRVGQFPFLKNKPLEMTLYIKNLPLSLDDSSIRVKIPKNSGWTVRNIKVEIDRNKKTKKVRAEEKEEELKNKLSDLENQIKVIESQVLLIKKWLKDPVPKEDIEEDNEVNIFPFDAWNKFIKNGKKRLKILYGHRRKLELEKRKIIKEIKAGEKLLKEEKIHRRDAHFEDYCKNLKIFIYCLNEFLDYKGDIEISYIIPGAQWMPVYKLYIEDNYKKAKLVMGAEVAQRSGEDWNNTKLHFSSANLERIIELPDLPSRRIGRVSHPPPPSFRKKLPSPFQMFQSFDSWLKENRQKPDWRKSPAEKLVTKCSVQLKSIKSGEKQYIEKEKSSLISAEYRSEPEPAEVSIAPMAAPSVTSGKELCKEIALPPPSPKLRARRMAKKSAPMADKLYSEKRKAGYALPDEDDSYGDCRPFKEKDLLSSPENYFDYRLEGVEKTSYRGQLKVSGGLSFTEYVVEPEEAVKEKIKKAVNIAHVSIFSEEDLPAFQCIFESHGRATIPCDGHAHNVDIMTGTSEGKIKYITIPITDQQVFKRLFIKNPFETPVPGGQVQIFIDNSYVFTTTIKGVGKGGETYLPLGVEESIKVSRNTEFKQEEVGFTGSTSIATHGVEIDIKSLMAEPISIEVIERVPVKDEEEKKLEVKVTDMSPMGKQDEFFKGIRIKGVFRWDLAIEPGETGAVRLKYQISMPSKMEVVGGNRRS